MHKEDKEDRDRDVQRMHVTFGPLTIVGDSQSGFEQAVFAKLSKILEGVGIIITQGEQIMATQAEILASLAESRAGVAEISASINDLSGDVDALVVLVQQSAPDLTAIAEAALGIQTDVNALKVDASAKAAKYPSTA